MPPFRSAACHRWHGTLIVLAGFLLSHVFSASAKSRRPPFADAPLARSVRGEEALQWPGTRLPEVAGFHRMPESELRALILRDKSLWVDRLGRLFYVCDFRLPPSQL